MHLCEIRVRNFRNLKDVTVHLRAGLNALAGRNNVGKTNLLLAIRHALGVSVYSEPLWLTHDDLYRSIGTPNPNATIRIDLAFAGLNENQLAQFFEILDLDPAAVDRSLARIHFEATWNEEKKRFVSRRWGGPDGGDVHPVPSELLDSIPVTFLPALRDAETALAPGPKSRLAKVLESFAQKEAIDPAANVEGIFKDANARLGAESLVTKVTARISDGAKEMAGSDFSDVLIQSSEPTFPQILRTLKLVVGGNPVPDLRNSGLGYNNLLYMATILAHLGDSPEDECPLLLIEEPEAHLHPQLTVLLGDYFRKTLQANRAPQVLITTHSPTLAAHVSPSQICSVFYDPTSDQPAFNHLADAGLSVSEERQLERMLDITKSTLFFSKAMILVEGISEALLVPQLAKIHGVDLVKEHISVLPICGVAFETFLKILKPEALGIPVAIITDGDPLVDADAPWRDQRPEADPRTGEFVPSGRTQNVVSLFSGSRTVGVFPSRVTLEYDLAAADENNAVILATVWERQFSRTPGTLNRGIVESIHGKEERALEVWRGVCRANSTGSKAELAHMLAAELETPSSGMGGFVVPAYIQEALDFLKSSLATPESI
jgi:putative ATP-dependent endonuclease of OLD family